MAAKCSSWISAIHDNNYWNWRQRVFPHHRNDDAKGVCMSWGRGGMVGVSKAIYQHEQTIRLAETILAEEHGTRHKPGEHELCPKCRELKEASAHSSNAPHEPHRP